MKIIAVEKELNALSPEDAEIILKEEARKVWELTKKEIIREIYFSENKEAILVIEAENALAAKMVLEELPLVRQQYITFEIKELHPYTGYERLF
jgi:hypothetical protein